MSALFGLRLVRIAGFRSARAATFRPGPVCALVGEANVGKSNILTAVWTLLERGAPEPRPDDVTHGGTAMQIVATLEGREELMLEAAPPAPAARTGPLLPVVFLPAALRAGDVVAEPAGTGAAARAFRQLVQQTVGGDAIAMSSTAAAVSLVAAFEESCRRPISGLVVLIEEPELYLRPQAQRYLYRLLRELATHGNQIIYSTHAPAFLNVARLDELALVEHRAGTGTTIVQPEQLSADESFRALSEFDAERSELFLARAALLVEGRTEKLVLPFIFRALGHDPDREAISIVECGGKPNIPLFARICEATGVPYLVLHDRDAPPGKRPISAEQVVNKAIAAVARGRRIELAPDFEAVTGLHGHAHKPERAWRSFADIEPRRVPPPLADAVHRVAAMAGVRESREAVRDSRRAS